MSERDRSEFVALVAVACTVVIFLIGLWAGAYYHERSQEQRTESDRPNLHLLGGSPESYQAICNSPKDEGQADLCQQWRAADASTDSARWTQLQFWLGAIGFVGVIITVAYAIRAFRQTVVQAKAAVDGVAAATVANNHAIETAERQLRPYLFFSESKENLPFVRGNKVSFSFQNYGQTPGRAVAVQIGWAIVARPIGEYEVGLVAPPDLYGDIGPGALVNDFLINRMQDEDIALIQSGHVLLMRMRLTYGLGNGTIDAHDVTWQLKEIETATFTLLSKEERQREA